MWSTEDDHISEKKMHFNDPERIHMMDTPINLKMVKMVLDVLNNEQSDFNKCREVKVSVKGVRKQLSKGIPKLESIAVFAELLQNFSRPELVNLSNTKLHEFRTAACESMITNYRILSHSTPQMREYAQIMSSAFAHCQMVTRTSRMAHIHNKLAIARDIILTKQSHHVDHFEINLQDVEPLTKIVLIGSPILMQISGEWYITITERLLNLIDILESRINLYMYGMIMERAFPALCPTVKILKRVCDWGDNLMIRHGSIGLSLVGDLEDIVSRKSASVSSHDTPLDFVMEPYNQMKVAALSTEARDIYLEIFQILDGMSNSISSYHHYSQIYSISKAWLSGELEVAPTATKIIEHCDNRPTPRARTVAEGVAEFTRLFSTEYRIRHGVYPPRHKTNVKNYVTDRYDENQDIIESDSRYHARQWLGIIFDKLPNVFWPLWHHELASDRSVSLHKAEIPNYFNRGLLAEAPPPKTTDRKLFWELFKKHDDVKKILCDFMCGDIKERYKVISLAMKGGEIGKISLARAFAILVLEPRAWSTSYEKMTKKKILPYLSACTMADDGFGQWKKLDRFMRSVFNNDQFRSKYILYILDFYKWNKMFDNRNMMLYFFCFDRLLGTPGLGAITHTYFKMCLHVYTSFWDVPVTLSSSSHELIDAFMYIDSQSGEDGIKQKPWFVPTLVMILMATKQYISRHPTVFGQTIMQLGQGDNHMVSVSYTEELDARYYDEDTSLESIVRGLWKHITQCARDHGNPIKEEESVKSHDCSNYGKKMYKGGVYLEGPLKYLMKVTADNGGFGHSLQSGILGAYGATYQAADRSTTPEMMLYFAHHAVAQQIVINERWSLLGASRHGVTLTAQEFRIMIEVPSAFNISDCRCINEYYLLHYPNKPVAQMSHLISGCLSGSHIHRCIYSYLFSNSYGKTEDNESMVLRLASNTSSIGAAKPQTVKSIVGRLARDFLMSPGVIQNEVLAPQFNKSISEDIDKFRDFLSSQEDIHCSLFRGLLKFASAPFELTKAIESISTVMKRIPIPDYVMNKLRTHDMKYLMAIKTMVDDIVRAPLITTYLSLTGRGAVDQLFKHLCPDKNIITSQREYPAEEYSLRDQPPKPDEYYLSVVVRPSQSIHPGEIIISAGHTDAVERLIHRPKIQNITYTDDSQSAALKSVISAYRLIKLYTTKDGPIYNAVMAMIRSRCDIEEDILDGLAGDPSLDHPDSYMDDDKFLTTVGGGSRNFATLTSVDSSGLRELKNNGALYDQNVNDVLTICLCLIRSVVAGRRITDTMGPMQFFFVMKNSPPPTTYPRIDGIGQAPEPRSLYGCPAIRAMKSELVINSTTRSMDFDSKDSSPEMNACRHLSLPFEYWNLDWIDSALTRIPAIVSNVANKLTLQDWVAFSRFKSYSDRAYKLTETLINNIIEHCPNDSDLQSPPGIFHQRESDLCEVLQYFTSSDPIYIITPPKPEDTITLLINMIRSQSLPRIPDEIITAINLAKASPSNQNITNLITTYGSVSSQEYKKFKFISPDGPTDVDNYRRERQREVLPRITLLPFTPFRQYAAFGNYLTRFAVRANKSCGLIVKRGGRELVALCQRLPIRVPITVFDLTYDQRAVDLITTLAPRVFSYYVIEPCNKIRYRRQPLNIANNIVTSTHRVKPLEPNTFSFWFPLDDDIFHDNATKYGVNEYARCVCVRESISWTPIARYCDNGFSLQVTDCAALIQHMTVLVVSRQTATLYTLDTPCGEVLTWMDLVSEYHVQFAYITAPATDSRLTDINWPSSGTIDLRNSRTASHLWTGTMAKIFYDHSQHDASVDLGSILRYLHGKKTVLSKNMIKMGTLLCDLYVIYDRHPWIFRTINDLMITVAVPDQHLAIVQENTAAVFRVLHNLIIQPRAIDPEIERRLQHRIVWSEYDRQNVLHSISKPPRSLLYDGTIGSWSARIDHSDTTTCCNICDMIRYYSNELSSFINLWWCVLSMDADDGLVDIFYKPPFTPFEPARSRIIDGPRSVPDDPMTPNWDNDEDYDFAPDSPSYGSPTYTACSPTRDLI